MAHGKYFDFPLEYEPSEFECVLTEHFDLKSNFKVKERKEFRELLTVFVCFINRSGSNFLCSILENDNRLHLNVGEEVFDQRFTINACNKLGITSYQDYLYGLIAHSTSLGKVPTLKISWDQLYFLTKIGFIGRCLRNVKFVFIYRQDVLSQAKSYFKAEASGQWINFVGEEEQLITAAEGDKVISLRKIVSQANWFLTSKLYFDLYFLSFGIRPLQFEYEKLSAMPVEDVMRECSQHFFGTDWSGGDIQVKTKIQRTQTSMSKLGLLLTDLRGHYFPK